MLGSTTALYGGLLGVLFFALSMRVSMGRGRHQVSLGDGGHPEMLRVVRVHANFAEFVPLTLMLILLVELADFSSWIVHLLGGLLLFARLAHAQGLLAKPGRSPGRFVGALISYLVVLAASILALLGHFGRVF